VRAFVRSCTTAAFVHTRKEEEEEEEVIATFSLESMVVYSVYLLVPFLETAR
jgi:hypothetical protein